MNKNLSKAVAVAVLAMGATAANAGIVIPAGDWTVDIGGNVNGYYNHDKFSGSVVGGSAASLGGTTGNTSKQNTITTGLLPSALGIGAKSRQGDFDVGIQFTFFTGIDSTGGLGAGNSALGANSLNIRQAFLTFGDKSWGTIKVGRDLGVYEGDAILSDMTLLGVGSNAGHPGSSTLGRIGVGYLYADWKSQIQYASPNWNGFSFAAAVDSPWVATSLAGGGLSATGGTQRDMGFEGKAAYEWAGDFAGKVWVGGISQKVKNLTATAGPTANGWDIGGKVGVAGFELVGSYYDGEGIGKTGFLTDGFSAAGAKRDGKGGYVQATYKLPTSTKIGASWGESKLDAANAVDAAAINASANGLVKKDRSWIVGAYHPLTKSVNLVAEYTDTKGTNLKAGAAKAKDKTFSLGAILFF